MIELFSKGETSATFNNIIEKLKTEITNLSDEKIISDNLDEWVEFFIAKYQLETIELYMNNITQELYETKIQRSNPFGHNEFEPAYFLIDGYKIIFHITFEGDNALLYLRPSTFYITRFQVDSVMKPTDDKLGNIIYSFEFTKKELEEKEDPREYIKGKFDSKFKTYKETISNINVEVEQFNESLEAIIRDALGKRKQKAKDFILMGEKLNIPLSKNQNAPNTTPLILKRKEKKISPMPTQKLKQKEYEISEKDYVNIKNIINLACNSMEKTARTFIKFSEEELRDVILSNLNSHYQGLATGETFNKVGKTDIRIQFENKAAYIGECKIWHGKKNFQEALEQLFSYTTWRDSKTSLIIFNKENKDFNKVTFVMDNYLKNCEKCNSRLQINKNEWQCTFLKSKNSTEQIAVQIVIYDLYVAI